MATRRKTYKVTYHEAKDQMRAGWHITGPGIYIAGGYIFEPDELRAENIADYMEWAYDEALRLASLYRA